MYYLVLISALLCSCGSPQTSNKPGLKAVEKKGLNLGIVRLIAHHFRRPVRE